MAKKILVVDDSALLRKLLTHILGEHAEIDVVGAACDAQEARAMIKTLNPDVICLDIEMPGMNGLDFLEKIMTLRPTPVVMISTLTTKGAAASIRALELGAVEVIAKPKTDLTRMLNEYKDDLHRTVLMAANANVKILSHRAKVHLQKVGDEGYQENSISKTSSLNNIVAIGASTGGTEAIRHILSSLPANFPGTVITQHIPEGFAESFAERLNEITSMTVKIAEDGDRILTGHAYVAPGHLHLSILRDGASFICKTSDADPVNRHRPSVDVLFQSVAKEAKNLAMGLLLTGMGKDGAEGLLEMKNTGAKTLVQDEASSVVWGMPGAAFKIGAADSAHALDEIAGVMIGNLS